MVLLQNFLPPVFALERPSPNELVFQGSFAFSPVVLGLFFKFTLIVLY